MLEFLQKLFTSDYMPHGHCYFWQPSLIWLHSTSDALIALSYFLIPFSLIHLVRKRRDLEFNWMFVMFGVFILSCGVTHLMNVYNIALDANAPSTRETVHPGHVLDTIQADLAALLSEAGATISYGDLPPVLADETHVKQVFLNLVTNAVKYQQPGQAPVITISARPAADGMCSFSVRDNGVGIPPQYQADIFTAFKRLHGKEYPGSGVGLTICKSIVEENGGRIWVESEIGVGSTFHFTLPAAPAEQPSPSSLHKPSQAVSA